MLPEIAESGVLLIPTRAISWMKTGDGLRFAFQTWPNMVGRRLVSQGTFQRDEASKRTEGQVWSNIPVTAFGWKVEYRAGRWGTDINSACDRVTLGLNM